MQSDISTALIKNMINDIDQNEEQKPKGIIIVETDNDKNMDSIQLDKIDMSPVGQ